MDFVQLLNPETSIEREFFTQERFVRGLAYGKPRAGHPEGVVAYHVREVLDNVHTYASSSIRTQTRLIAFLHDSFKHEVNKALPRHGENHHGMIARRFAEGYITDASVLEVIELHDEAYNAFNLGARKKDWRAAEERACALLHRLGDARELYLLFYRCDNETGDKSREGLDWFSALSRC